MLSKLVSSQFGRWWKYATALAWTWGTGDSARTQFQASSYPLQGPTAIVASESNYPGSDEIFSVIKQFEILRLPWQHCFAALVGPRTPDILLGWWLKGYWLCIQEDWQSSPAIHLHGLSTRFQFIMRRGAVPDLSFHPRQDFAQSLVFNLSTSIEYLINQR
jgi:hypothetical protein